MSSGFSLCSALWDAMDPNVRYGCQDKPPSYGTIANHPATEACNQQQHPAIYPSIQSFAPVPAWPSAPPYPLVSVNPTPNFQYQPPVQQQQVVLIHDSNQQSNEQQPPPTFCCQVVFSCFVFWIFNPLFGMISFILASKLLQLFIRYDLRVQINTCQFIHLSYECCASHASV
jgi:hypothetical protein